MARLISTRVIAACAATAVLALFFAVGLPHLLFGVVMWAVLGYIGVVWVTVHRKTVHLDEGGRLVVKERNGAPKAAIDLGRHFTVSCIHNNGDWVMYRVTQDRKTVRFVLPLTAGSERIARAMKVKWPPPTASPFQFVP